MFRKNIETGYKKQIKDVEINVEKDQEAQERKENLEKKFDEQGQKLLDLGYHEALEMDKNDFLDKYIEPLRKELNKVPENIPEGNIPFLIVIPDNVLGVEEKMSLVRLGEKTGYTRENFDFKKLKDAEEVETPKHPYLIYNIRERDEIKNTSNVSIDDDREQLASKDRRGFTAEEGIALISYDSEILQNFGIKLVGSQYCSEAPDRAPALWLVNGRPELRHFWMGKGGASSSDWGAPSCEIVK